MGSEYGVTSSAGALPGGGDQLVDGQQDGSGGGGGELQKLHRLMRGRYVWAIVLGVVLGAAGAYVGYRLGWRTYRSVGQLQIRPLADGSNARELDSFLDLQVSMIRGERVLNDAIQDPRWDEVGRAGKGMAASDFMDQVEAYRKNDVVSLIVTDRDPKAAAVGVKTILAAYQKFYRETEAPFAGRKLQLLQQRESRLSTDLLATQGQLLNIVKSHGADDVDALYSKEFADVEQVKADLDEVAALLKRAAAATQPVEAGAPRPEWTTDEIARVDPKMQQLTVDHVKAEAEVRNLEQVYGAGANHPELSRVRRRLELLDKDIQTYAAEFREMLNKQPVGGDHAGVAKPDKSGDALKKPGLTAEELVLRQKYLQGLLQRKEERKRDLGEVLLTTRQFRTQERSLQSQLDATRQEIAAHQLNQQLSRGIEILNAGDTPVEPDKDNRLALAGAGGFGGIMTGFGIMLLVGLLDRRLRSPDDAGTGIDGNPLLGILPWMPDDLGDPEQAARAAHCVHEIRALLQIRTGHMGHRAFAVTSPVSGTGKTSLTLAMGVSFAATGLRTLMIDCDLVGGGLTSRTNMIVRRKIGHILHRKGLVTSAQLDEAIKLANGSRLRFGEILVELGHLKRADLDRAIAVQGDQSVGILDALAGDDIEHCVAPTGLDGLHVLPLGSATARDVGRLSPASLARLVEAARRHFDVVLIDTGPIPGSLEASLVASQVDGVILTVSRGEQRPLLEQSAAHLRSVGARVAGVVFNRATDRDAYPSSSRRLYGSVRSQSSPAVPVVAQRSRDGDAERFGPIADAVVSHDRLSGERPGGR